MTSPPTIQSKFLSNSHELGVVAVGFSGGQVCTYTSFKNPPPPASHLPSTNPLSPTQQKPGVDTGPGALISAGLLTQLQHELGYTLFHDDVIHTYTSLIPAHDPPYRNMKRPLAVSAVTKRISEQVYEHAREGRCVLTLGGDHSIAIGTIGGTAKAIRERLGGREMAVIWVDAHADINTPETSASGNIHGMPVAFLTGIAEEKERDDVFGWLSAEQRISFKKLVYIGLRDVDREEKRILKEHGIKVFSMHDIDRYGIFFPLPPFFPVYEILT